MTDTVAPKKPAARKPAAATICMAFVIFCVAFTLPIRLRISFRLAINASPRRLGRQRAKRPAFGRNSCLLKMQHP